MKSLGHSKLSKMESDRLCEYAASLQKYLDRGYLYEFVLGYEVIRLIEPMTRRNIETEIENVAFFLERYQN